MRFLIFLEDYGCGCGWTAPENTLQNKHKNNLVRLVGGVLKERRRRRAEKRSSKSQMDSTFFSVNSKVWMCVRANLKGARKKTDSSKNTLLDNHSLARRLLRSFGAL